MEFSIKKILKNINYDELFFDAFLLIITGILSFMFTDKIMLTHIYESFLEVVVIFVEVMYFIFFIEIGSIVAKYKKEKKKITGLIIIFVALFLALPFLGIIDFLAHDTDIEGLYDFIALLLIISGFLFGFFVLLKNIRKAVKITAIIMSVILAIPAAFFTMLFFIGHDKFSLQFFLIVMAFIGAIVFTLTVPSFFAKKIEENPNLKKILIYIGLFLSALLISLVSILPNYIAKITGDYSPETEGAFFVILFAYRILLMFAPPRKLTSMLIGGFTILMIMFLY